MPVLLLLLCSAHKRTLFTPFAGDTYWYGIMSVSHEGGKESTTKCHGRGSMKMLGFGGYVSYGSVWMYGFKGKLTFSLLYMQEVVMISKDFFGESWLRRSLMKIRH